MKAKNQNLFFALLPSLGWLVLYFPLWLLPFAPSGENVNLSGYDLMNSLPYMVLLLLLVVLALVIFSFWALLIIYEGKGGVGEMKAYSFLFLLSMALIVLADGLFTMVDVGFTFTWGYYLALAWVASAGVMQVALSSVYVAKAKKGK